MLTLSLDTTAKTCSVALSDGELICLFNVNNTLTHSENLIMMIDAVLKTSGKTVSDVGKIALSVGPGSFTGVRIGTAAVKGIAFGKDIKIAPVSTLEALAHNAKDTEHLICATMDARRNQTYYAIFVSDEGKIVRLTEDAADSFDTACEDILTFCKKTEKKSVIFVGDGAKLCYDIFKEKNVCDVKPVLASDNLRFQNAYSVALAGEKIFNEGRDVKAELLECKYLRKPQAEETK